MTDNNASRLTIHFMKRKDAFILVLNPIVHDEGNE